MKHLKFLSKASILLALAFFVGAFLAVAGEVPQYAVLAGSATVALAFIPKGELSKSQLNAIVITDIIAEFNAYYRPGGQGMKNLITKLLQRSVTEAYFPRRITE